jgi:hypothetical protein
MREGKMWCDAVLLLLRYADCNPRSVARKMKEKNLDAGVNAGQSRCDTMLGKMLRRNDVAEMLGNAQTL